MAESNSPVICVTCKRPFEPSLTQDDSPRYFAQYHLLPKSDDCDHFAREVETILDYIRAVAYVTRYAKEVEEKESHSILSLIFDLAEEADRRNTLAEEAMGEIWQRDHGQDAQPQPERKA